MSRYCTSLLLATFTLALVACDKVPLLAPTGSSIFLSVNTNRLAVNSFAEITATVVESAGTPPQNGTLVSFSASLGTIEPRDARTEGGRATVRFTAGSQSGTARINAVSGGAQAEEVLEIQVGGAAVAGVSLRAEPASVPNTGGTVTIVAAVRDDVGNRLAGIPVSFSSDGGQLSTGQATTDANGEARASLTTNRDTIVTVTAAGQTGTFTIRATAVPAVTITFAPAEPQAGLPVTFTITPQSSTSANVIRNVEVDFGDGKPRQNLGAIAGPTPIPHVYDRSGFYTVTVRTTDAQGLTGEQSIGIVVTEQAALSVTLVASPNIVAISGSQQGIVSFTATATGGTGAGTSIQFVDWDFGDGGAERTTSLTNSHRYSTPGTYVARARIRATNGQEGSATATVRVTATPPTTPATTLSTVSRPATAALPRS